MPGRWNRCCENILCRTTIKGSNKGKRGSRCGLGDSPGTSVAEEEEEELDDGLKSLRFDDIVCHDHAALLHFKAMST